MPLFARRRTGTSPSFWRGYHNAQFHMASSCMRSVRAGFVREESVEQLIADFERTKRPAAPHFVSVSHS